MGSLRDGAIRAKILIWGPPGSGKTATLSHVSSKLKSNQKGELEVVELQSPPCKYEILPIELGEVKGVVTRLDFQTVPGPWEHAATRKKLLAGVDAIVFVANSIGTAMKENQKSLAELEEGLKAVGKSLVTVPVVFQWMNQKAIGSTPPDEMTAKLNRVGAQAFPVTESDSGGMLKAFSAISKMAVKVVRDDYDAGRLVEDSTEAEHELAVDPPTVAEEGGENPFADLAADLDKDLGDGFEAPDAAARPLATSTAPAVPNEPGIDEGDGDELDAILARTAGPKPGANGKGFRLLGAGEPALAADGTLSVPIRIASPAGDELAMTLTVKLRSDA